MDRLGLIDVVSIQFNHKNDYETDDNDFDCFCDDLKMIIAITTIIIEKLIVHLI